MQSEKYHCEGITERSEPLLPISSLIGASGGFQYLTRCWQSFCQVFFGICEFPLLFTAVGMCLLCHKYAWCGQHVHVLHAQQSQTVSNASKVC